MKKIAIIGAKGNMGRRYGAILDHLNVEHVSFDLDDWMHARETAGITGVIIASGTDSHFENLDQYSANKDIPILCEKPIVKDQKQLDQILSWGLKLTMVNQYAYLIDKSVVSGEITYYDYWNTGKDGLEWDCINIIGAAKNKKAFINNKSPVWRCALNGQMFSSSEMDQAYIDMVKDWLENPTDNMEYIRSSHKRIWSTWYEKGCYRNPSEDQQHEAPRQVQHVDQRKADDRVGDRSGSKVGGISKQRESGSETKRVSTDSYKRPSFK
jgi:hypothetical protein